MAISSNIWILLPDGIGVRNFIYTGFLDGKVSRLWTPLSYLETKYDVLPLPEYKGGGMLDLYKNALIKTNLKSYYRQTGKYAYLDYIKKKPQKNVKQRFKEIVINLLAGNGGKKRVKILWKIYLNTIRSSKYYHVCKQQLEKEKPSMVFCTNQRMSNAAAPILAARDLNIPTATFIFSWDNMPKGNLSVPAEYLFVWSDYMKEEAKQYYPWVDKSKIYVTGTPQFIQYTDMSLIQDRKSFCKKYGFDTNARIICFSGDDITTSPYDPLYLEDTAKAVRYLNKTKNENFQILFRRCPVDLSDRYDKILKGYSDVIIPVEPLWKKPKGMDSWESIIPTLEDMKLLANTVYHCETAVNVGSTIAHDFACMGKTSCYLNYNVPDYGEWDIHKIYQYIHFQSMGELDPIYWVDGREKMFQVLLDAMIDKENKIIDAQKWLQKIVKHPLSDANNHIWEAIEDIVRNNVCI